MAPPMMPRAIMRTPTMMSFEQAEMHERADPKADPLELPTRW